MQGTLCLLCWVCAKAEKLQTEGLEDIYILFWNLLPPLPPLEFYRFVTLLLENKILPLWILQNCVASLQGFNPFFFCKVSWHSLDFETQVPWHSLTLARNESKGSHIFANSKCKKFKGYSRRKFTLFQGGFNHDVCLS